MAGTGDTSIRSYRFYTRTDPVLTADFADCKIDFLDDGDGRTIFTSNGIIISNDSGANELQFSYDGTTVEGDLLPNESMNFAQQRKKVIYLRCSAGASPYRIWAW